MPKLSSAELVDAFKNMTLLDLTEFRRQFEETFDVTAEAPAPIQVVHDGVPGPVDEEAQQTEFDVTLESFGENKISVIKVVREITKLGLAEAKAVVDAAPKVFLQGVTREAADDAADRLRSAGATVTVA